MKLSDFDYNLPKELIANYPLKERDQARLLVLDRGRNTIAHRIFKDITDYFGKGDLLVLNDTKVLHCRLKGRRQTGGKVEILLLGRKEGLAFDALIRPGRIRLNEKILFNGNALSCTVTARNEVTFSAKDRDAVYHAGMVPLPPYIKREPEDLDSHYYQTVYAKEAGSVASPTAGLHFTKELLAKIKSCGVSIASVTLHVGYATFKPVKADDVVSHKMDAEYFHMSDETSALIDKTHAHGGRIFAVGTTSCRLLETYARLGEKDGFTDLFIYPGYTFKMADCLLTNFHLPRTTLLMLACAFAGTPLVRKAYQEAIDRKYRFYSYGDAMLIV